MINKAAGPAALQTSGQRNQAVHYMRGLAAIVVVISHLGLVFFGYPELVAAYLGVKPLEDDFEPVPGFFSAGLLLGQFGVGLFFVISGYVIPRSFGSYTRGAFFRARFWRLWPTYAAGFTLSLTTLWLLHVYWGQGAWRFSLLDVLLHYLIGLRDLAGTANIDGIVWTLEIEVKFYLVAGIAYAAMAGADTARTLTITACAFAGSWILWAVAATTGPTPALSSLLLFCNILILMNAGSVIQLYDDGFTSRQTYLRSLGLHGLAFFACATSQTWAVGDPNAIRAVYLAAALVFIALRFCRVKPNWALDWCGRISYPLYVIHSTLGYAVLYVCLLHEVSVPASLALAAIAVAGISILLHFAIEAPSMRFSKAARG